MGHDRFPTTLNTWLDRQLRDAADGRAEINRHVMEVYRWPLTLYFRGTRDRWLGEPDDIVQGFFADRLDRAEFFADWRKSGLRLRRWLMNAFCFYLSEQKRKHRRNRPIELPEVDSAADLGDPHREMDRAFAIAVVRQALSDAQRICGEKGLHDHWQVFVRHYYDEQPYQAIAGDIGVASARAAVMARTAARHFRSALRDLLSCDGAPSNEIDDEIVSLLGSATNA